MRVVRSEIRASQHVPGSVLVVLTLDNGRSIAGSIDLGSQSPGTCSIGVDEQGCLGVNLPSPIWSSQANIPDPLEQVDTNVVPDLSGPPGRRGNLSPKGKSKG